MEEKYEVLRKSLLGNAYTLKKNGKVLLTANSGNFLPILNRSLGGFISLPHVFTFSDDTTALYRKAGLAKENFSLHIDKKIFQFRQKTVQSYQITITGADFSGEIYPLLTQRKFEIRQQQVLLAIIYKKSDLPEVLYEVETLMEVSEAFLLAAVMVMDNLIAIPY